MKISFAKMIFLPFLSFLVATSVHAKKNSPKNKTQYYAGTVEKCHDGDTCRILVDKKIMKVRFHGIDAPEIKQEMGKEAQKFVQTLLKSKNVELECKGQSFDRTTCTVFLDGKNINKEIVQEGYAWESKKYSQGLYSEAQQRAQAKKLGLWSKAPSASPYCFRKPTSKKCKSNQLYMD